MASRFVERAFLDYAAEQGRIKVSAAAPLLVESSKQKTLENIISVQGAFENRLTRLKGRSTLIARQATLDLLSRYLVIEPTSTAPNPLPAPMPSPLPAPLNLRLLQPHLDLLSTMAGKSLGKVDVLSAALQRQAENIGLDGDVAVDELGLPRTWLRYPHPELLDATNTVEDTALALIVAYRSLGPFKPTIDWARSATALNSGIAYIKLSKHGD